MKHALYLVSFLLISFFVFSQDELIHNPKSYIDDFAGIIDAEHAQSIQAKIVQQKAKSTVEIAVVTVNSLGDREIEDFTRDLGNKWGVGGKSNNGLIILIAPNERKWRIEVGPGLQGDIPDITAKELSDRIFPPYFKQKQFGAGIEEFIDEVILKVDPEAKAIAAAEAEKQAKEVAKALRAFGTFLWYLFCIIVTVSTGIFIYKRVKNAQKKKEQIRKSRLDKYESLVKRANKYDSDITTLLPYNSDLSIIQNQMKAQVANVPEKKLETMLPIIQSNMDKLEPQMQGEISKAKNRYNAKQALLDIPSIITNLNDDHKIMINEYNRLMKLAPDFMDGVKPEQISNAKVYTQQAIINLQSELKAAIESGSDQKYNGLIAKIKSIKSKFDSDLNMFGSSMEYAKSTMNYVSTFNSEWTSKINAYSRKVQGSYVSDVNRKCYESAVPGMLATLGTIAVAATLKEKYDICKNIEKSYAIASAPSTIEIARYEEKQAAIHREEIRRRQEEERQRLYEQRKREEAARKKREAEEEEERERQRRNSYNSYSSSSSSWGSSSSSSSDDNSSSYSGGSFDGGGSSGSW